MRVLVTGAQGNVGMATCAQLQENGHHVVPFDIKSGDDTRSIDQLRSAVAQAEATIHLAAIPYPKTAFDAEAYWRTNVEPTFNLANLAAEAKHSRFVFPSSTAYYGFIRGAQVDVETPRDILDENGIQLALAGRLPDMSVAYNRAAFYYMTTKIACECALAMVGVPGVLNVVIFRLAAVGDTIWDWGLRCRRDLAARALAWAVDAPMENSYTAFNLADFDVAALESERLATAMKVAL